MAQANGQLPGSTGRKADEIWRHPARGTGQIVEKLEQGARTAGAVFHLSTEVLAIPAEGGRARSVIIRQDGAEVELEADRLIGSLPMPLLLRLLRPEPPDDLRTPPKEEVAFKKSTALVYLMAEGAPSFPHNWLEVTEMSYKAGRIVNYATWNGDMVPPGKTGLCMEYFCIEGDGVMDLSNEDLLEVALDEAGRAGLIDRERVFDTLVIKLPHANAATVTTDWKVQWMLKAAAHVNSISHFYETNRPGMDRAALAGIDAAAACRTGEPMSQRSLCSPPDAV